MVETLVLETPSVETASDIKSRDLPANLRVMLLQIRDQDAALQHEMECVQLSAGLEEAQLQSLNVVRSSPMSWAQLRGIDALLIGGSGDHSVTQDYPFIGWMEELVQQAVVDGTPVFGICWGHHFLGRALGGVVETLASREEIGTCDIELTGAGQRDPLLAGFPRRFAANLVHHDSVTVLPEDFIELGKSEACPYQIIRHRDRPVVGTQFHGEMDAAQLSYRLSLYQDEYLDSQEEARGVTESLRPTPVAGKVLRRFLELYT